MKTLVMTTGGFDFHGSVHGCWYHPKHVQQFPDKINSVTLHLVGYILEQPVAY